MKKYQPSNGTEGMQFMANHCDQCMHMHPDSDAGINCLICMRTMTLNVSDDDYPEEWTYNENNEPTCTAYVHWDWNSGDWRDLDPIDQPKPFNPNQLKLEL